MNSKYLVVVVGPTAIGKTAMAVELAKHFKTEILSADSRQFFKEMRIGTAVPTMEELEAAPHHFVQHKSVTENYSVGDFEREALEKLEDLFRRKDLVVMVGGSGLYVDAVCKGLDEFPDVEESIRRDLNKQLQKEGIEALQKELKEKDREYYEEADIQNPHRIIRALEICIGTGKPYSSFRNRKKAGRPFKTIYIGLDAERQLVYERINKRVDLMLEEGLLEEAETLYPHRDLNALNTVGYKELFRLFDEEIDLEEAVEEIKKNTRRFAKRQFTWFRKNKDIKWFDRETPPDEILAFIEKQMV